MISLPLVIARKFQVLFKGFFVLRGSLGRTSSLSMECGVRDILYGELFDFGLH